MLCWARALGEFGATITFAGNLEGTTQTLPLFVYVKLQGADADAAIVLSFALLAVSVAVLVGPARPLAYGPMTLVATVGVDVGAFTLDVDLTCAAGETVAIVGPNGSGKTTLLRTIAGLQKPARGRIELDGVVLDGLAPEQRSIGFMFQDDVLFPHLRVLDNVAFGLRARGVLTPDAHRRAEEWLTRVGLAGRGSAFPDELSGGQAQRVALARALGARARPVTAR